MGGVGSPMIIEGNPLANGSLGLRPRFPSVQVDAFILEGPPEALDEDIVDASAFAVHGDPGASALQPVRPGKGREL